MTSEEAIQQLEFDRAMMLFDSLTGEEITPEMLKLINKENYLTYVADGIAIEAIEEIQQYRKIGTVEECRKAVEKQKAKKCVIDSCPDHTHYKCPSCGKIHLSRYKHGCPSLGRIPRFCEYCGQAIDENLEGMEDE